MRSLTKKGGVMVKRNETMMDVLKEIRDLLRGRDAMVAPDMVIKPCVINDRFVDNGDGTITDKQLKVIWVKDPSVIPELQKAMNFDAAKAACSNLKYAGFNSGWRMPTVEELRSIVDYTRYEPAWDINVFGGKHDNWYWTSTPCAWSTGSAWCVSSNGGHVYNNGRDNDYYVRPVRSSQ